MIIARFIKRRLERAGVKLLSKWEFDLLEKRLAELTGSLAVEIKLSTGAVNPTQPYVTDACWDLYAYSDVWLRPGESTEVPTGVYINIPVGYEGELKIRSSLGKLGLSLHHGAFDAGYQGEISPFVQNWTNARYEVKRGDRICQFTLRKKVNICWQVVEKFTESRRKDKGHGSSGK